MGLFYSFVSLDNPQLKRRRELLDLYGQVAQFSALIPLLFIYATFLLRAVSKRYRLSLFGSSHKAHQSPKVSTFSQSAVGSWKSRWRRLSWALDDEVLKGWDGWGTRREWFIAGLWALWLLVLVVRDTGDDYLHLTKRFGIVAASQLPLHYLLAAKSWSPIQHLTRMSHEELNPYHRLLGRILIAFFSCHAALYINFYVQSGLFHRFGSQTVILGLIAVSTFVVLGTSSLTKIRNYSYLLFFVLHVALSIAILPILWFHVSHLRIYIIESALVYILIIAQRNVTQTPTLATLSLLPSSSPSAHQLLSTTFPLPRSKLRFYAPGQHIYLGLPPSSLLKKPWEKLRLNPFTIASISDPLSNSLSTTDHLTTPSAKTPQLTLLIRPLRSSTAILKRLAQSSSEAQPVPVLIEGPYGSASYLPDLSGTDFSGVLLVAGGVGATFTLPIYQDLYQKRGGRGSGVKMVWSVRRKEEAIWGLKMLGERDHEGVEVYVTKSGSGMADNDGDMELEEHAGLLGEEDEDIAGEGRKMQSVDFHHGRPDLKTIVRDVFEEHHDGTIALFVCGPPGMGKALRREVGIWVGRGREVFWHAEEFGW